MFERPEDREVVCHATATDFYAEGDYRIKMCTKVTGGNFRIAHHEMGHVQYFMHYRNRSFLYREGANPGFHEGMADVLSIATGKD